MADSRTEKPFDSDLYKAFFDDATLSDLTVQLSDRTVSVHRIVLCRRSEYFTKLLTGQFRESGAKEIILKEDDAESMVALLRYIYGLPYGACFGGRSDLLQPHAKVYVVAEKYQLQGLKLAASKVLKRKLHSELDLGMENAHGSIVDFMDAFQAIVKGTATHDDHVQKLMVDACVWNLKYVRQTPTFLTLWEDSPGLSMEIMSHRDLECGLSGDWVCELRCEGRCELVCYHCSEPFGDVFAMNHRGDDYWDCKKCERCDTPACAACDEPVVWKWRGL